MTRRSTLARESASMSDATASSIDTSLPRRAPSRVRDVGAMVLLAGFAIGALALCSGSQWQGDALAHFQRSMETGSLADIIRDNWTRPIPRALFAAASRLGLAAVFIVPGLITALTAVLVGAIVRRIAPDFGLAAGAFAFLVQLPVLEVGYLTLNPVPFAALLTVAIWTWVALGKRRPLLPYLLAGLLPLCRAEGYAVAVALAAGFMIIESRGGTLTARGVLSRLIALAAGTVAWMGGCWWVAGDPLLPFRAYQNVVSLRTGPWTWIVLANALTRLPIVISPLLIPLFAVGLLRPCGGGSRSPQLALLAVITVAFGILSAVFVAPDDYARFYVASNAKSFAAIAPALAILIAQGLGVIVHNGGSVARRGLGLGLLLVLIAWPLDLLDAMGPGAVPRPLWHPEARGPIELAGLLERAGGFALELGHTVKFAAAALAALILWLAWLSPAARRPVQAIVTWLFGRRKASLLRALSLTFLALLCVFAYPGGFRRIMTPRDAARFNYACLEAFGEWYRDRYPADAPDVVHSVAPSLEPFCRDPARRGRPPHLHFRWQTDQARLRDSAPPGTLFLVGFADSSSLETDPRSLPFSSAPTTFQPLLVRLQAHHRSVHPILYLKLR